MAHERVQADVGKVAVERGPVVYCFEEVDNGERLNQPFRDAMDLSPKWQPDLLGGVTTLSGDGLTAIPYYAWAHRGVGAMTVWMERGDA